MNYIKYLIEEEYNNFINEKSIINFNINNIIKDDFLDEYISETGKDYIDIYKNNYDVDDDTDYYDIIESEDFREFIRDELIQNFEEVKEELIDNIDISSGKIKIYRHMKVDINWINHLLKKGKRLGIYWSWDEDSAFPHWGDINKPILAIIESEIDERYVDWIETLKQNTDPRYKEEKEIRLFKNTPIKINNIILKDSSDKKIDIDKKIMNKIKNKIFYA